MTDPGHDDRLPHHDALRDCYTTVSLPISAVRHTVTTLALLDEFFRRHASSTVHHELRAFCTGKGWHPVAGAQSILDDLGFGILPLQRALDTTAGLD